MDENQHRQFSLKQFKETVCHHNIAISFQGILSQDILALLSQSLRNIPNNQLLSKRLFSLAVEMTQNIHHYSAQKVYSEKDKREIGVGIVCIGQDEQYHFISSGNYIHPEDAAAVQKRSRYINTLTETELKEYYREQRRAPQRKDKPGANLGFIEMRRKSGNPVYVEILNTGDDLDFFVLSVRINKEDNTKT